MRKYFSYFRLNFITCLQYRSAALAGILTQMFFGLVFIMVYITFYESGSSNAPMELSNVISYLWLNQMFFVLVYFGNTDNDLLSIIKNGNIAYELCRPQNMYFKYYAKILSTKLSGVLLRILPMIVLALLLPKPYNLSLPPNVLTFLLFLLALIISIFLSIAISMIVHVVAFYTIDASGVLVLLVVISEIFSGGTIPLPFFPEFLRKIAEILPFSYVVDFPFRFYSGSIPITDFIYYFSIEIIWTILCILIGYFSFKKILKKTVIQGG